MNNQRLNCMDKKLTVTECVRTSDVFETKTKTETEFYLQQQEIRERWKLNKQQDRECENG